MIKKVLILGAGMVAPPLVKYLIMNTDCHIVIADQDKSKAECLAAGYERATPKGLDINDQETLSEEIKDSSAVVSIIPYTFHSLIARICIQLRIPMITASYVSDEMKSLDREAASMGVLIMNEIGLDPGIDHMEAMRIIHDVEKRGGIIQEFTSYCGGLPAPDSNNNPLGYKFSWSPIGVLMAGKNSASYLFEGEEIKVPPERLFLAPKKIHIDKIGELEGYPNRNSIPYQSIYGIRSAHTILRGTLRYPGWCPFIHAAGRIGLLKDQKQDLKGLSYLGLMGQLVGSRRPDRIVKSFAEYLGEQLDADTVEAFSWLGFFEDEIIPFEFASHLEVLAQRMQERLQYLPGERDIVILQHRFSVEFPERPGEAITSTLIDYGIPGGDSAMARTVGLPLGICTRLVLENKIDKTGVQIPVFPELYLPILAELEQLGIAFHQRSDST